MEVRGRQHLPAVAREALDQDRVRLAGHDVDRVGVDHVGPLDGAEAAVDLVHALGNKAIDGELHRLRVERLAVVELHALAELELPGERVDAAPGDGQLGHELADVLRVPRHQRVVDVVEEVQVVDLGGLGRIEGRDVGALGDHQILGDGGSGGGRAPGQGQGEAARGGENRAL